jgi:hypothetical protein
MGYPLELTGDLSILPSCYLIPVTFFPTLQLCSGDWQALRALNKEERRKNKKSGKND